MLILVVEGARSNLDILDNVCVMVVVGSLVLSY